MLSLRSCAAFVLLYAAGVPISGAPPKEMRLEFRKNAAGLYVPILQNQHPAAATAYLARASYRDSRERHTALGGDTLGFTNGSGTDIPAHGELQVSEPLPPRAEPVAAEVLAVIYADGTTEGEDEVVAMLLSGRQRAYADLKESLPALEKAAHGQMQRDDLSQLFLKMQSRDHSEAETLDDIQNAPGRMRYRFFLSAVPARALESLSLNGDVQALLNQFRAWKAKLETSNPSLR